MAKKKLKLDLNSKMGKYLVATKKGLTKKEAQIVAGYSTPTQSSQIEASETFKAMEKLYYRDRLTQKITLDEIADEQVKVIKQDKDLSSKNKAIEMALNRIEPETSTKEDDDRLVVVLRQ